MYHKLTQFCIGSLLALFALLFTHSTQANSLVNDPFIRQHIDKSTFEPGGQNHLFGSARGSVADRKGDIYIIPTASIQAGGVSIDQAVITGNYQYNARFSGHEHDEHSPFANSNSKQKTAEQGITGVDFTSLSMQWQGKEVHPADAYDGKQGSGYPTPTGARDEYSYTVAGSAIGARLNFNDNRTAKERLKDRKNAIENARNTITDAFEQGLTHNPNLNKWGNAAEVGSAVAKGLGAAVGVPFEWLGVSDVGDGIATAKDLATLEAMRELSHENKLKATDGLETVQKWQDEYNQWRAENPNKAAAADTAINTVEALSRKGGDRVEAKGDKTTGSRGGNATDTGATNANGQTIYQRDSGGYYSNNPVTGKQQVERSPYPMTDIGEKQAHHHAIVQEEKDRLRATGNIVPTTEVYFKSPCGNYVCIPDITYKDKDGNIQVTEVKTGNASLSRNQTEVYPAIENGTAIPFGKGAEQLKINDVPLGNKTKINEIRRDGVKK